MKIEYRNGDMFKTDIKVLAHGCNAQGVMGSGVAKIVRDDFPLAYNAYLNQYAAITIGLAMGCIIPVEENDKVLINAITQQFYGGEKKRYVSYDAVSDAMRNINEFCECRGHSHVAMPQIGAGLGGGNWNVIATIIESEFTNVKPVVYIY